MPTTDKILINGLEFYAYHGASDQEQTVGHRYQVDARLTVDTRRAAATDHLTDTVSYSRVAKRMVEVATAEQFRLLETLAQRLADTVLAEFPTIKGIELRVQKMCPPMNAIVASVGVEITRSRDGD
jgi:dihydroneopterin aldolase